jgi:hypothetical protein
VIDYSIKLAIFRCFKFVKGGPIFGRIRVVTNGQPAQKRQGISSLIFVEILVSPRSRQLGRSQYIDYLIPCPERELAVRDVSYYQT